MMGFLTARFLKVGVVDFFDQRVLMALTKHHARVFAVQGLGALCGYALEVADDGRLNRLSAAIDAAAGAGHDLDEVILFLPSAHLVQNNLCIGGSAEHADPDWCSSDLVLCFFDAVGASHLMEFQLLQLLAGQHLGGRAEGCLHHAAGSAEDMGRAGGNAQGPVKVFLRQVVEQKSRPLEHPPQLSGGNGAVHIRDAFSRAAHVVPGDLKLLGRAGHGRHHIDVFRVKAHLFGVIALGHGAEHLHGTLAAGEIRDEIRMEGLTVLNPARTAAGEKRQLPAVKLSLQEFRGLLHDGQVRREIRVKDRIESQASHCRAHLAFHVSADGEIEHFPETGPDAGRCLDDNIFLRVIKRLPHPVLMELLMECAGGTGDDALSAVDAGRAVQLRVKGAAHVGGESTLRDADGGNALVGRTDRDASAAENTLIVVPHHMGGGLIQLIGNLFSLECHVVVDAVLPAETLQLAVAAPGAGKAGLGMDGQNQLQVGPSGRLDPLIVGKYFHPLADGMDTGRHQVFHALHFHHADAAGADLIDFLQVAQCRNRDSRRMCRLQYG